ncbi:MAG: hypothetical protein ACYTGG_06325 [Planctomycetota bacterium]|jgi:hypothetical protein
MMRLWSRWRAVQALDSDPHRANLPDPRQVAPDAADMLRVDQRLRRDLPRAHHASPPDLRRRILRTINDAPRPQIATGPGAGRAFVRPALATLAAMVVLTAVLAPEDRPAPPVVRTPSPTPANPTVANAQTDTRFSVDRLIRSSQETSRPRLEVPLVNEVRLIAQDARKAREFMLAHIPARYRPDSPSQSDAVMDGPALSEPIQH